MNISISGGQSIALRHSKQIRKTNDQMRDTLTKYKEINTFSKDLPFRMVIDEVRSPDSNVWHQYGDTSTLYTIQLRC